MIYENKKLIFIHIYKTAGKTVEASLSNIQDPTPLKFKIFNKTIGGRFGFEKQYLSHQSFKIYRNGQTNYAHIRASDYQNFLGNEKFKEYFKFSFVRNPFDWQVSLYFFMKQKKQHFQHKLISSMNFDEYISWRCNNEPELQTFFLYDDSGILLTDFVGKFEKLDEDLKTISKKFNFNLQPISKLGASKHDDYRNYYDKKTESMIAKTFAKDFDLLNYSDKIL